MYKEKKMVTTPRKISFAKIREELSGMRGATIIAAYYDRLMVVASEDSGNIDLDSIVRLRAFTKTCELYVWRSNNVLEARLREDEEESEAKKNVVITIDTKMIIDPVLTREKGPFAGYSHILLRNYANYNENDQLYYNDMRIVSLI